MTQANANAKKKQSLRARALVIATLALAAPAAHAQQWLVNSAIQNQIIETAICDDSLRKHERLPDICAKYPKYSSGAKGNTGTTARGSATVVPTASPTAMTFTPVAGDDVVQKLADSLGGSTEERKQMLDIASAGRQLFEQKYAVKGWNNNLAGAMTFFIVATATVHAEREPDAAAQERLFASLNATLAQSDLARASDKDKTALYNALLACAGLPLVFYVDGKQQGNASEVQQAKAMAAGFSKKLLNVEPQVLAGML